LTVTAPAPRQDWALFLDIDGTLLDIAASPGAVVVPDSLAPTLAAVGAYLNGALAIASGRTLGEIDALLAPLRLPCVAEHGAVIRHPGGAVEHAGADRAVPPDWRARLHAAARDWPGVLVEEKSHGVAVHFRQAPGREGQIRDLVEATIAKDMANFEVLPANMAFEIRHHALTKAIAVKTFMTKPPFSGRVPVFVGDDVTDEDGFRAAKAMGGLALNVHACFAGRPEEVRRWLARFVPPAPL
jgi:trehalose 6-phosphate phosphatase